MSPPSGRRSAPPARASDVLVVEALRTPLARGDPARGALAGVHPVELAALVLGATVERAGLDPSLVDDVILGCVSQTGEQALNIARQAVLQAGFPVEVPATTVDRQCGSSQQAVNFGAALIASGVCEAVLAGGVESMSRVPMGSAVAAGPGLPHPPALQERYELVGQGQAAELVAERWGITRAEADALAAESQRRAATAQREGRFERELVPVPLAPGAPPFDRDQGVRPETTLEGLAALRPAFRADGILHAGNSSQISDGAAAVLLTSARRARELGLRPRARVRAQAVVGVDPVLMLTGPIPATTRVLERAGLGLDDVDLFEVNEAFAPVVLAWSRELEPDMSRVNVNGGAIALGHPLGASGARLMATLLHELERTGGQVGLQTMCCGGGLGTATIIDREL